MRHFVVLFLVVSLYGCQDGSNNAQGRWEGLWISNGVAVDIGTVYIGADYIDIPGVDERYNRLSFENDGDKVRFSRKQSVSFQGDTKLSGLSLRYPSGMIELLKDSVARMKINKIQGVIELTRA